MTDVKIEIVLRLQKEVREDTETATKACQDNNTVETHYSKANQSNNLPTNRLKNTERNDNKNNT